MLKGPWFWPELVFWLMALLAVYGYLLFPLVLIVLSGRKNLPIPPGSEQRLPPLSIVLAMHNEEAVLAQRLDNLLNQPYPAPIEVLIGTDACTDGTDRMLAERTAQDPRLRHFPFATRQGKPNIINQLVQHASYEVLILTDANVFFTENTLPKLARHFIDARVGLVSCSLANKSSPQADQPENTYMGLESELKLREGLLFGATIGATGQCYAIRRSLYRPTPPRFIADDFYIGMEVLLQHKRSILDPEALALLPPLTTSQKAFRRRVRISTGNFQNMGHFWLRALHLQPAALWCYFSHKILRWLTPFFLVGCLLLSIFLYSKHVHPLYSYLLIAQLALLGVAALGALPGRYTPALFKALAHFYYMNLGILVGFWQYAKGVKTNAWSPTQRTVKQ